MSATTGPEPSASATDVPNFPSASASGSVPGTSATSETNLNKRNELLHCMRNNQLVVVLGTGVSLQTVGHPGNGTAVAGWVGLLEHGLAHCGHHHGYTAGKEEKGIAAGYRERAGKFDLARYTRIAATLRSLAESYERDAERDAKRDPYAD